MTLTSTFLCKITNHGRTGTRDVFTKIWCNYKGKLLTVGKMITNELLKKTLPRAAMWIYVLFQSSPVHPYSWGIEQRKNRKRRRAEGRGERTNALDFNKELSQQYIWPYINYAEALGNMPKGPEHSSAPLWSLRCHSHKIKLFSVL